MEIFWKEKWNTWKEDWSNHPISPDQARIDAYLETCKPHNGKKLLYVGIGNSELAVKFQDFGLIDGLTVLQSEIDKANSLNLKNYRVFLCNKHTSQILALTEKYDYIIDNGIFTFTDCDICSHNILFSFYQLLKDDGMILTDTQGMFFRKEITVEKLKNFIEDHKVPLKIFEFGNLNSYHVVVLKKDLK